MRDLIKIMKLGILMNRDLIVEVLFWDRPIFEPPLGLIFCGKM
jgi:hypothetical protein